MPGARATEDQPGPATIAAVEAVGVVDRLAEDRRMAAYHLLPAVRGDLLERLERREEAANEFSRAAGLTGNEQERRVLKQREARNRKFSG